MHMHAYACTCMHMHAYARICMHMHAYACICMHMHSHASICMHMQACECIYMHVHAYACMHMQQGSLDNERRIQWMLSSALGGPSPEPMPPADLENVIHDFIHARSPHSVALPQMTLLYQVLLALIPMGFRMDQYQRFILRRGSRHWRTSKAWDRASHWT